MTIHLQMLDFLREAHFGGLRLGMKRQQMHEMLGDPPEWIETQRKKRFQVSNIWKYGSIEFHFMNDSDILSMIFSDHFPLEGCETLLLDPWILKTPLFLNEARTLFDQVNLIYQISKDPYIHSTHLTFESGVTLNFHTSDKDDLLELTGFALRSKS